MGRAVFVGLSAAFFIGYSIIASSLLIDTSGIVPLSIGGDALNCDNAGFVLPGDPCYNHFASNIPVIGQLLSGVSDIVSVVGDLFGGFFQLITFQAGLPTASAITLLIFVPLGFINGFIIFTAIRGSG